MCNPEFSRQLDEQRMLYVYQGLNAVMKLLNEHLDSRSQLDTLSQAYKEADEGKIIAMAAMAMKNGKITHQQYEEIFDIAMGIKTVDVHPTRAYSEPSWNETYLDAHKFLNQYRPHSRIKR